MKIEDIADHALPKLRALPEEQAKTVLTNLLTKVYKEGYQRGIDTFYQRLSRGNENHS